MQEPERSSLEGLAFQRYFSALLIYHQPSGASVIGGTDDI